MIRINLLATERGRPRVKVALAPQAGQKITVACSLILLAAALGIVWWFWTLRTESERLDQELAGAAQETVRLQSVLEQVQQFEARRALLEQRVSLIEELRRGQSWPVHLLDQISRSLPDRLWLTELRQKDAEITIDGRAVSLSALSDFIGNLEASGYFQRPVEILSSQVEAAQGTQDLIRFSVKATFSPPGT